LFCGALGLMAFFVFPPIAIPPSPESRKVHTADELDALINQETTPYGADRPDHNEVSPRALWAEIKHRKRDTAVLWVFAPFVVLSTYFYFTTASEQLMWLASGDKNANAEADQMAEIFAIMIPSIGFVASPIAGRMSDLYGMDVATFVMITFQLVFGIFSVLKNLNLQYITFVFVIGYRCIFWVLLPRFLTLRYTTRSFGRMYGLTSTIGGLFALLGYALNYLAKDQFGGSYFAVNVVLCIACTAVGLKFFFYILVLTRGAANTLRRINSFRV